MEDYQYCDMCIIFLCCIFFTVIICFYIIILCNFENNDSQEYVTVNNCTTNYQITDVSSFNAMYIVDFQAIYSWENFSCFDKLTINIYASDYIDSFTNTFKSSDNVELSMPINYLEGDFNKPFCKGKIYIL